LAISTYAKTSSVITLNTGIQDSAIAVNCDAASVFFPINKYNKYVCQSG